MNSCCACVASHAAGAVKYLIEDDINGIIYENNNFEDFYKKVKALLLDKNKAMKLGKNAYETICSTWNADVAAKRLINLISLLEKGDDTKYINGPCSRAELVNNNWYKSV